MATKLTDSKNTTKLFYNERFVTIEYFFTNAASESFASKSHKILIELSFTNPVTGEQVDLCVVKSVLLLCQPVEVIEAVVQREAREFLKLFPAGVEQEESKVSEFIKIA